MKIYEEINTFSVRNECIKFELGYMMYRPIFTRTTTAKIKVQDNIQALKCCY